MKKIFCFFGIVFLLYGHLFAQWDRYANESESIVTEYALGTPIARYWFSLSSATTVDFYTDDFENSDEDTYMYLWSETANRQMYKNDDAYVPSGHPWASRITMLLPAGSYYIIVRAYNDQRSGRCTLYRNGSPVKTYFRFAGTTHYYYGLNAEDRLSTTNLMGGTDTYCLLLDLDNNLIGFNDDDRGLASSFICPVNGDYKFICGSYSESTIGWCAISRTPDANLEFISLCGNEQRHVDAASKFTSEFNYSHNPAYSTCVSATDWQFQGQRLSNTDWGIDNVDFLWMRCHGRPDTIFLRNKQPIRLAASLSAIGGGNRILCNSINRIGDLEYIAIESCYTVYITHTQTNSWLDTDGWKSTGTTKGLFDGLHMIVGYHTPLWYYDPFGKEPTWIYTARTYANKLESGKGIWQAWWETNEAASQRIFRMVA